MAYSPSTQIKIEFLLRTINAHPEYGASRLQAAIKKEFGSELRKQYLLKESQSYRQSQRIQAPKSAYAQERHFGKIMRLGSYTDFERRQFLEQINTYTPEGKHNWIYSPTVEATAKDHRKWLMGLVADAQKELKLKKRDAQAVVYTRLQSLLQNAQYDPFHALAEEEQANQVFSGLIQVRPVNRDYTDRRREHAIRKRQLVRRKVLGR